MKNKTKRLLAGAMGLAVTLSGITAFTTSASGIIAVDDTNRAALIGVEEPDSYFLGVASQFSVFLREDFAAEESDCEGRLAVGGNANIGSFLNYSVGAKFTGSESAAHVVVGGDTLTQFSPGTNNFVVGTAVNVDDALINGTGCSVYEGSLFDFDAAFDLLEERSAELAAMESNAELTINPYYERGWTITGTDEMLNVLTLDDEQLEAWHAATTGAYTYIELVIQIPEDSYLVINVPGEEITMPMTNLRIQTLDGTPHGGEGELAYSALLFNLPEAQSFHYSGSIQGSTLAPYADVTGNNGGHVSGATIANSFAGGIEFGYSMFNPTLEEIEETTTTETTTTTTETTTTTTTTESTTTTTTTTTTESTTTTTTTETTTTTTEPTTTATTTTTAETTTTTATESTTTTTTTTATESTTTTTTTEQTTTTTTTTETTTTTTTEAATTTTEESTETTTTEETEETTTTTVSSALLEDTLETTSTSRQQMLDEMTTSSEATETQEETTTTTTAMMQTGSVSVGNPNTADRKATLPLLGAAVTIGLACVLRRKQS